MGQKFTNVARATLASGISESATEITITTGAGTRFPVANTGLEPVSPDADWYKIVFQDVTGQFEIAYVRTHASDADVMSNIVRGQEGTTAQAWGVGTIVGLRLTAADIEYSLNAASTLAEQVSDLADQVALIVSGNAVPAGVQAYWPSNTAPAGWFALNGQAVSRAGNPGLFALYGTTYGAGDGSTTFNLPDDVTNNRFWRAAGGSVPIGTAQDDQNKEHTHTGSTNSTGSHNHTENRVNSVGTGTYSLAAGGVSLSLVFQVNNGTVNTSSAGAHSHTVTIANQGGAEARPKSRAWLPIVKAG